MEWYIYRGLIYRGVHYRTVCSRRQTIECRALHNPKVAVHREGMYQELVYL